MRHTLSAPSALPSDSFAPIFIVWAIATLLAFFGGLAATTENPILIGLFVGAVGGTLLLSRLDIAIWVVVIGTLVIGGLTMQFAPFLGKSSWLFSMVGFLLFIGAILSSLTRKHDRADIPWYIWLAIAFPIYALFSTLVQFPSIAELLAGFKRYFQFYGLLAALALVRFPERFYTQLFRFVMLCALVQVFLAAYQLAFVVPKRFGMGNGVVPIDAVTGTFEATLEGGGASSVMATFILVAFTFLLSAWRDGLISARRMLLLSLLILAPLALGETKIAVIFLPIAVLVAIRKDIAKNPLLGVFIVLLCFSITAALGYLYLVISTTGSSSLHTTLDNIIAYNFGHVGYHGALGLNRSTVLSFWWGQQSWSDPLAFVFGHGIGASYSGTGSLVAGHLARNYGSLAIGFTGLSSLLWDLGVFGTLLYLLIFFGAWLHTHRIANALPAGTHRSVALAAEAGIVMNAILIPYSNSIVTLPSHEVFCLLMLIAALLSKRSHQAATLTTKP